MQTVVLFGNSLIVSAIGANLKECADIRPVRVDAACANAAEQLAALDPIAVVFDRAATPSDLAVRLLDQHPDLLLIGADPSSDRILILSGRQEQPIGAADLVQLISRGARVRRRRSSPRPCVPPRETQNPEP